MSFYKETFIDPDNKFNILWNELDWERRDDAPRREYWYNTLNRPYSYGRGAGLRTYYPRPTHSVIEGITDILETELGFRYEGCFLNSYETSRDALGWHSDDDPGIDHNYPIAVVSLYGDGPSNGFRVIQTKKIASDSERSDIESFILKDGSLFLMDAGSQSTHLHRIPKAGFVAKPRISLTYRKLTA
jgi:alkylated DNA repair dioxygenase AlkB